MALIKPSQSNVPDFTINPKPSVVDNVRDLTDRMMGRTFTRAEADHLIATINMSVEPIADTDEPIKDLLWSAAKSSGVPVINDAIREAFKRGRESR